MKTHSKGERMTELMQHTTSASNGVLQLPIFEGDEAHGRGSKTIVYNVDPAQCRISRFNTRKTRDTAQIQKLAQRILNNGFELTRALWVYRADDGCYEVFAGGNRLEAARVAGKPVHVVLHENFTYEEISLLADRDNEDDEYHAPVKPMDVWAEYARLKEVEGWTGKRIAEAKKVHPTTVGERISWNKLPVEIKSAVVAENTNGALTEAHLRAVSTEIQTLVLLEAWALVDKWRVELLQKAIKTTPPKSSRKLADEWNGLKTAVENATVKIAMLPEQPQQMYKAEKGTINIYMVDWRNNFVDLLVEQEARTSADVDRAFVAIGKQQADSANAKKLYDEAIDSEQQQVRLEQQRLEHLMQRWLHGDCTEHLTALPEKSVRVLLTDPPYGADFQSNRRTVSAKAEKIASDGDPEQALDIFNRMLTAIAPKLADEAHLLVFTRWQVEPDFRRALEAAGYSVRGSLVWVKENHTSGDLDGAFAPKHERILHATKGHPAVSPRIPDVFIEARGKDTEHPTEKPVKLLKQLIEVTSKPGNLVVDPFGGTAATLVAAKLLEREWFGCEVNESYWNAGFERLKNV